MVEALGDELVGPATFDGHRRRDWDTRDGSLTRWGKDEASAFIYVGAAAQRLREPGQFDAFLEATVGPMQHSGWVPLDGRLATFQEWTGQRLGIGALLDLNESALVMQQWYKVDGAPAAETDVHASVDAALTCRYGSLPWIQGDPWLSTRDGRVVFLVDADLVRGLQNPPVPPCGRVEVTVDAVTAAIVAMQPRAIFCHRQ